MSLGANLWSWIAAAAFVVVGLLGVRSAVRRRDRGHVTLGVALGLLGVVAISARLEAFVPGRWLSWLSIVAFAASGYALLEHRSTIVRLSMPFRLLALGASAAAAGFVMVVSTWGEQTLQMVSGITLIAVWGACILQSAWTFWRVSADRPPVNRARMRSLAVSYAGFVAMVAWVVVFAPTLHRDTAQLTTAMATTLGVVPFLYIGLSPPRWLRTRWLERAGARQAAKLVPVGYWYWDINSNQVAWSPELSWTLGADPATVEPTIEGVMSFIHPDDREDAMQTLLDAAQTGEAEDVEYRIVAVDGTVKWLFAKGDGVVDPVTGEIVAMYGAAQDITQFKETELALRESERRLGEAQHLASVGSWDLDRATGEVRWSDELFRIHGLEVGEPPIVPDEYVELVHPDDREAFLPAVERVRDEGAPLDLEYRIVHPDGAVRWIYARGELVRHPSGRVMRIRGICQDVTDRKEYENALRDALEREQEATERLRALDEMKDSLLAAVSHELRTPLTVVLGLAQTLQRSELMGGSGTAGELLGRLEINAARLERLLLDLLDLDRLSRGTIEPRRRPTDMRDLVARVVEAVDRRGHEVEFEVGDLVAMVDPPKVERIVENLIANAAKHTPDGTPIRVCVTSEEDGTLIVVSDDGPGVPDELKAEVFEPFSRGGSEASGTGIGLSLVSRFAKLHGGRAWVEDVPGGGASFRVLLPDGDPDELEIGTADVVPIRQTARR